MNPPEAGNTRSSDTRRAESGTTSKVRADKRHDSVPIDQALPPAKKEQQNNPKQRTSSRSRTGSGAGPETTAKSTSDKKSKVHKNSRNTGPSNTRGMRWDGDSENAHLLLPREHVDRRGGRGGEPGSSGGNADQGSGKKKAEERGGKDEKSRSVRGTLDRILHRTKKQTDGKE